MGLGLAIKGFEVKEAVFTLWPDARNIALDLERETAMTARMASAMAQPIPENTMMRVCTEAAANLCLRWAGKVLDDTWFG